MPIYISLVPSQAFTNIVERFILALNRVNHTLNRGFNKMAGEIEALTTEVGETKTVMASAVVLINGINDRIQAAVDAALAANPGADLSALTGLTAELDTEGNKLAAAVAANTPAATP